MKKDISSSPMSLDCYIQSFAMGIIPKDAPSYIHDLMEVTDITSLSKEDQDLFYRIDRAQQTLLAREHYVKVTTTEQVTEQVTKQNSIEFAKSLLTTNMPIEEISLHTGLTEEEIIQLRSNL